jgi:anti-sigma regulatory factor (Ser/Thr protein kinase)
VWFDLPPVPSSATKARQLARDQLAHCPADVTDTVALLVTELVTNAVVHARTDLCLGIEVVPPRVRLSVSDGSTRLPVVRHHATSELAGRGLALVDALASRWGVESTDGGKSVWCEVLIPDAQPTDPDS